MAAKVVSVKAIAITARITMDAVMESFIFGVICPPVKVSCVVSLNKYCYF